MDAGTGAHIVESIGVWPVTRENRSAELVSFNLPDDGAEAGAFEAELEAADAREQ